ncbi:MAG: excinuclease ABC subunit UvrC [bacterium]
MNPKLDDPPGKAGLAAGAPNSKFAQKLAQFPDTCGVYLMKNKKGEVIYVGKAVSLIKRVRAYRPKKGGNTPKEAALLSVAADVEYIVTDSEIEALILECNLIKRYRPRYNVLLKDDKAYPLLKVTLAEDFPRVYITRRMKEDGAKYFGPYTEAGVLRGVLKSGREIFPLRTCKQKITSDKQARPCLNFHIQRCLAPCAGLISREEYRKMVDQMCLFLAGRGEEVITHLKGQMKEAAGALEFEKAAQIRDRIKGVESILAHQKMVLDRPIDEDVLGLAQRDNLACLIIFFIRQGRLIGREHFILQGGETPAEIVSAFIKQHYLKAPAIPPQILLPCRIEEENLISEWLRQKRGSRVNLKAPKRGEGLRLLQLAVKNASLLLAQKGKAVPETAAEELKDLLGLKSPPLRIEAFDISNLGDKAAAGSVVVFENGRPKKGDYRRFKIKSAEAPDDYGCLEEVVGRRYRRLLKEKSPLPDLIVVDGGRGQLSSVWGTLLRLGLEGVPLIALAKTEEEIFTLHRSSPILLARDSPTLHLLQHIRDEAHRFALKYHRHLRTVES